jgi:PST family polysaccharide transporter
VLIGGSQAFNVVIGIVRAKAIALLLGPGGFGLVGLYTSIANLAQSVAGMGISSSGVREIAAAVGSGESERIARTAAVLRRISVVLGLLGALVLAALAVPVSRLTFGEAGRALPVALLSLAVLFRVVSDGQGALIQGLRRIGDLTRIAVLGGFAGTVLAVALVFAFRERGVVPALVAMAGATLAFSWWYSRKAGLRPTAAIPAGEVFPAAAALLKLGLAFMSSAMLTMGAAYAVRLLIARKVGLDAAGLYQSAWTIGVLYVGFVLQAMGADFYPRLTASIQDRPECNRLVNEQALVSMLLAGPGILATLTFAPVVVALFYSTAFLESVEILRWICLGATLQVVTWPMGFIIVAEGKRSIFFWSEVVYTLFYLGAAWILVGWLGAVGAGVAFFASYVFHAILVYPIVRWITGFTWSAVNRRMGILSLALIGSVFVGFRVLPAWLATVLGTAALLFNAVHSARVLVRLVSPERLPRSVRWLLVQARLVPRAAPPGGGR